MEIEQTDVGNWIDGSMFVAYGFVVGVVLHYQRRDSIRLRFSATPIVGTDWSASVPVDRDVPHLSVYSP
jgi:hypothetical protein